MAGDLPDFYGAGPFDPCALTFLILPRAQCEAALFGFIRPGSRRTYDAVEFDGHPGDWFWAAFCKTQYASMISTEHLLACHLGLVRVLDHAATLGIGVEVHDETGYWEHRSTELLVAAVTDMNRLIARFAGALGDQIGDDHSVEAPIFDHPDFEHLEMEEPRQLGQADGDAPD